MNRRFPLGRALAAALCAAWLGTGLASGPALAQDDALDKIFEKLEETSADDAGAKDTSKGKDAGEDQGQNKADSKDQPAARPSGAVDTDDQALDNLLEKLGATEDAPEAPDDRRRGPAPDPDQAQDPAGGHGNDKDQPSPDRLDGDSKDLDAHLEELLGRRRKRKNDQQEGQGQGQGQDDEGTGPFAKVIKEMREVEQRLGKPDTSEETRRKQAEIVKNLDQIIEQMRSSSGGSQGRMRRMLTQAGQRRGSQPGQTPGANPGGAPPEKPAIPKGKAPLMGDKDAWGHLPDSLREELANVAKEEPLPARLELIRRYYLSVSQKALSRKD